MLTRPGGGGGGFCSIFIYAHLSWGGGGVPYAQIFIYAHCQYYHIFSHIFKVVKMGRKKGQKVMNKKGKAALHLEQHWSFNFDNVSEDSLITKGHVLCYLIDNTVMNLIDKLLPLLKTDTRSRLYGRARHLYQLYTKKNHRNLSAECNMITFDKFCHYSVRSHLW